MNTTGDKQKTPGGNYIFTGKALFIYTASPYKKAVQTIETSNCVCEQNKMQHSPIRINENLGTFVPRQHFLASASPHCWAHLCHVGGDINVTSTNTAYHVFSTFLATSAGPNFYSSDMADISDSDAQYRSTT